MGRIGIVLHKLNGINGWSSVDHKIIDIAKVISVKYFKREFKIFDKEYDYTLRINYSELITTKSVAPVFTTNGVGFAPITKVDNSCIITKRYKTEQDVLHEINEINTKIGGLYLQLIDDQKQAEQYIEKFKSRVNQG